MLFTVILLAVSSVLCVTANPTSAGNATETDFLCELGPYTSEEWERALKGPRLVRRNDVRPRVISAESGSNNRKSNLIGGKGGQHFHRVGCRNGSPIVKLEVWMRGGAMKGIKLNFEDGEEFAFGKQECKYYSFDFQPGEIIRSLRQTGNGIGTRHGMITITTSADRKFETDFQSDGSDRRILADYLDKYDFDVHSGILCGIHGRAGDDIDLLGFLFVPRSISSVIKVESFGDSRIKFSDIQTGLDDFANESDVTMTFETEYVRSQLSHSKWEIFNSAQTGHGFSISASFGGVGIGYELEKKTENGKKIASGRSTTMTKGVKISARVPPYSSCNVVYNGRKGVADSVEWTGSETLHLEGGGTCKMPVRGVMSGIAVTQESFTMKCKTLTGYKSKKVSITDQTEDVDLGITGVSDLGPTSVSGSGCCCSGRCKNRRRDGH